MKAKYILIYILLIFDLVSLAQVPKLIGPPGGVVFDIGLHRNYPNVLYSCTQIGGGFRSTDGGMTVRPLRLVGGGTTYYFYPSPTDTTLLFLITYPRGRLLKSNNAGRNLSFVVINNDSSNNTHLQFNPYNDQEIYLIRKEKELWKSYNRGIDWNKIITFDTSFVSRIAVSSTDTSVIYVTAADRIYRSTNSGLTWELRGRIPGFIGGIVHFEVSPLNKNTVYLDGGNYSKFYKSDDGGKTFSIQSEILLIDFALSTADTNIIYGGNYEGLFKSTDEGKNWIKMQNGLPENYPGSPTVEIDPSNPNEIYAGIGDLGTYKSVDNGNSWQQINLSYCDVPYYTFITNEPGHIITTQYPWVVKMTTDDGENWFVPNFEPQYDNINGVSYFDTNPANRDEAYFTDNAKTYKTIDGGLNWQQINPFLNSTALWYNKYNSNIQFGVDGYSTWRSTNNGMSWEAVSGILSAWYDYDPQNDSVMYAYGYYIKLLKSTDMGNSWQEKTNGLIRSDFGTLKIINEIAIRKDNPNILYCVQGSEGGISKSTDGGENWYQIDSSFRTLNTTMSLTSIYLDDDKPNRFYVSTNGNGSFTNDNSWGGLFRTEDDGLTWIKLFTGSVSEIKADNSNPKNIYFNTYFGIVKIPDTLTTGIAKEDNFTPSNFILNQNYPNPFNPTTTISWQAPVAGHQTLKIYDVLGNEIATLVDEYKNAGKYEVEFKSSAGSYQLPSGVYFYKLQTGSFVETKKMLLLK